MAEDITGSLPLLLQVSRPLVSRLTGVIILKLSSSIRRGGQPLGSDQFSVVHCRRAAMLYVDWSEQCLPPPLSMNHTLLASVAVQCSRATPHYYMYFTMVPPGGQSWVSPCCRLQASPRRVSSAVPGSWAGASCDPPSNQYQYQEMPLSTLILNSFRRRRLL